MPTPRKRHVQPEDFYLLRNVSEPQLSPDGKQVAYCLTWPDKESNETSVAVYVAPVDGRGAARRFTPGVKDPSPRWSPNGKNLAFLSDRGEKRSEEHTSELKSLMRISYAVICLNKKK